jgi:phosphopantothenoylcysteine decarboxylase / phosphopantothenate---cysteine ligase
MTKKILIAISGSVAAIKIPMLIHKLVGAGYKCKVIITHDGLGFVTPMAVSSMGADVYLDNDYDQNSYSDVMQHINLGKWADYIILAPASANTLAKVNYGFADNLLSATILASNRPKIIVPAMNQLMWKNTITQTNVANLIKHGFIFWGPTSGLQACGDNDIGRMIEVEEIFDNFVNLVHSTQAQTLSGKHIVITAGATKEAIDPVRYISNHSSGKMAYALASAAHNLGAKITLVSASPMEAPLGINIVHVETAEEMLDGSSTAAKTADIFIGCAAVCDYQVTSYSPQKIKKSDSMHLELTTTKDILKSIRGLYPKLFMVGFAAETENIVKYAEGKLKNKQLDIIVANDVSENKVFNQDYSEVIMIDKDLSQHKLAYATKDEIAHNILKHVVSRLVHN